MSGIFDRIWIRDSLLRTFLGYCKRFKRDNPHSPADFAHIPALCASNDIPTNRNSSTQLSVQRQAGDSRNIHIMQSQSIKSRIPGIADRTISALRTATTNAVPHHTVLGAR